MTTHDFRVTWEIGLPGMSGPVDAAEYALRIHRDPDSQAAVFTVSSEDGTWRVDLTTGTTELLWERGANKHLTGEEL